uniref:Uncharacterized protein n=1 Tax=Steinernema glaseri TaxID=37863 RepID=A0A1I7YNW2_9BILA
MLSAAIMVFAICVLVFSVVLVSCSKQQKGSKNVCPNRLKPQGPDQSIEKNLPIQNAPKVHEVHASKEKLPKSVTMNARTGASKRIPITKQVEKKKERTQRTQSASVMKARKPTKSEVPDKTQMNTTTLRLSETQKHASSNAEEELTLKSFEDSTQITASVRMADSEDTNECVPDLKNDGNDSELELKFN